MGGGCRVLRGNALGHPLRGEVLGALQSQHELRVESRTAIPLLTRWLTEAHTVTLLPRVAVHAVNSGVVETSAGPFAAPHIVVCPGPDLVTLFPDAMARRALTLCKLHMLRLASPGWTLPAGDERPWPVRYLGYAGCASLPALQARLEQEQAAWLADGIHLIAVQSADGSLVVGDSHHYDASPIRSSRVVDDRMLADSVPCWTFRIRSLSSAGWASIRPAPMWRSPRHRCRRRLVMVTSGTGASTGFALAEETIADLLGHPPAAHAPHGTSEGSMKLQAVILDWAGTVVDHGSRAPMGAFVRAFGEFGVAISIADARGPMGMAKWDHIRAVARRPPWRRHGGRSTGGTLTKPMLTRSSACSSR